MQQVMSPFDPDRAQLRKSPLQLFASFEPGKLVKIIMRDIQAPNIGETSERVTAAQLGRIQVSVVTLTHCSQTFSN